MYRFAAAMVWVLFGTATRADDHAAPAPEKLTTRVYSVGDLALTPAQFAELNADRDGAVGETNGIKDLDEVIHPGPVVVEPNMPQGDMRPLIELIRANVAPRVLEPRRHGAGPLKGRHHHAVLHQERPDYPPDRRSPRADRDATTRASAAPRVSGRPGRRSGLIDPAHPLRSGSRCRIGADGLTRVDPSARCLQAPRRWLGDSTDAPCSVRKLTQRLGSRQRRRTRSPSS